MKLELIEQNLPEGVDSDVREFAQLFQGAWREMERACQFAAARAQADPTFIDRTCRLIRNLTPQWVQRAIGVGEGKIALAFLLSNSVGSRRLSRLPISVQNKYILEGVPVWFHKENEPDAAQLLHFDDLSAAQACQAIAYDHVRSAGEQRAWFGEKLLQEELRTKKHHWFIRGGRVYGLQPDEGYTADQLDEAALAARGKKLRNRSQ